MRGGGAGDYRTPAVALARVLTPDAATGEDIESWPAPTPAVTHWCRVEATGGVEEQDGLRRHQQTVRVRFRNQVAIAAVDRVQFPETGLQFNVVGVWREWSPGGYQTVCDLRGPYDPVPDAAHSIDSVEDDGSGLAVLITGAAHGLTAGATISIAGTGGYDGVRAVTVILSDTAFQTGAAFVGSADGYWVLV